MKGYIQKYGLNYEETFYPINRLETIKSLLALASNFGITIYQMESKSTFLNGDSEEEVHVNQPQGFIVVDYEDKVLRLKKALYKIKRESRVWYPRIDTYFHQHGYQTCSVEAIFSTKVTGSNFIIIFLYVNNISFISLSSSLLHQFKITIMNEVHMSDMDEK